MGQDTLRSSMGDNVVSGKPLGGTSMETFDMGKQTPRLDSNMTSVGFEAMTDGMPTDIPGGLMTTLNPEETGSAPMDSSFGTPPISGSK